MNRFRTCPQLRRGLVLMVALLVLSCTAAITRVTRSEVITDLDALSRQAETLNQRYHAAAAAGTLPRAQAEAWNAYLPTFQSAYDAVYGRAQRAATDAQLVAVRRDLERLRTELDAWGP